MTSYRQYIPDWKIRAFWALFLAAIILGATRLWFEVSATVLDASREDSAKHISQADSSKKETLRFSIYRVLFDLGVRTEWLEGTDYDKIVRVPGDLPVDVAYTEFVSTFESLGGTLRRAEINARGDRWLIEVGYGVESLFKVTLVGDPDIARVRGKIAIVIDDFGYSFNSRVRAFLDFEQGITISVMPGLEYSGKVAAIASEKGKDVLIHMPMEPESGDIPSDDFVLLNSMSAKDIRARVRAAIKALPQARGLNNHMGSSATVNEKLLKEVMTELKKSGLLFLDSKTSRSTVAHKVARKAKVPWALNDLFLDAILEEPFVRDQITNLADLAVREGSAIGIGHPGDVTLRVLQEELPRLEKKGFQFVGISELVNQEK